MQLASYPRTHFVNIYPHLVAGFLKVISESQSKLLMRPVVAYHDMSFLCVLVFAGGVVSPFHSRLFLSITGWIQYLPQCIFTCFTNRRVLWTSQSCQLCFEYSKEIYLQNIILWTMRQQMFSLINVLSLFLFVLFMHVNKIQLWSKYQVQ